MANLNPFEANPETIKQYNETLKILIGVGGSIVAVATAWITHLSKKTETAANKNTDLTAANNEALASHTKKMLELEKRVTSKVETFIDTIEKSHNSLNFEFHQFKELVHKSSESAESKLNLIPKVQDAVEALKEDNIKNKYAIRVLTTGLGEILKNQKEEKKKE